VITVASPRRAAALAALLVVAVVVSPSLGAAFEKLGARSIAPGVRLETWTAGSESGSVRVARAEPDAARLVVVPAAGGLRGGRETTSSICRRVRGCLAAVNGDFFTDTGPVGGMVVNGVMLRSPAPDHEQLSLAPLNATARGFGTDGWTGSLRPAATEQSTNDSVVASIPPLALDGVNVPLRDDLIVLYTSAVGPATEACVCTELVLRAQPGARAGVLGVDGRFTIVSRGSGRTPLDPDTAVVAATGRAGERLAALADRAKDVLVRLDAAAGGIQNVGAHPILMRRGVAAAFDTADPMLSEREPRTAVAWDDAGRVWLVAIDGRRRDAPGLTAGQTVQLLRKLGAQHAVLEDGGGSTTFVAAGRVLNSPSDGRERPVANAIILLASAPRAAARRTAPTLSPAGSDWRGLRVVPGPKTAAAPTTSGLAGMPARNAAGRPARSGNAAAVAATAAQPPTSVQAGATAPTSIPERAAGASGPAPPQESWPATRTSPPSASSVAVAALVLLLLSHGVLASRRRPRSEA